MPALPDGDLFWFNFTLYWVLTGVRILIDPFLPRSWIDPDAWPFRLSEWEEGGEFYRRVLHIDRWKDRLPTFAGRTGFDKKRLSTSDPAYLAKFVTETCRGESHHLRSIGSVLLMRLWTPFSMWLVMVTLATMGNLPFIAIQRYNRPRLRKALELSQRRAALLDLNGTGLQPGLA